MKFRLLALALGVSIFLPAGTPQSHADEPIYVATFRDFEERAESGEPVSIVFFGGSLTAGLGSSVPEQTSFRALTRNYLQERYPKARLVFHDASLAGTGSKLGMFRVDEDVIAHKPHLVFLDFTTDDKVDGTDRETLASYERILRELIGHGIPVVELLAGTSNHFAKGWSHLGPTRYRDHLQFARLYHAGVADSFPVFHKFFINASRELSAIWPTGSKYPNDVGHRLLFDAVRMGLDEALDAGTICYFPRDAVFADEFVMRLRHQPARYPLPTGWQAVSATNFTSVGSTFLAEASRVAAADPDDETVRPLTFTFSGTFLGIIGPSAETSAGYTVSVDGKPIYFNEANQDDIWPTRMKDGGEPFFWHQVTSTLSPGSHTVEIWPVWQDEPGDLRIESLCVAGPSPTAIHVIAAQASDK